MGCWGVGSASSTLLPCLVIFLLLPLRASAEPRQLFKVLEEQPPGTWIGTIATRPGFTYRLSEHHALFSINATSGDLHTLATIDRESLTNDVMDLVVLSSQPTYPSEVRIMVLDLNDNAPVFPDPSIVVTFKEDTGSGRQLILDTATDADSGTNGVDHSSYRIVDGNEEGRFRLNITLNPSGEGAFLHLVSRGGLDREASSAYQLLVQVDDKGEPQRHGFLQVNVTVQDINDNPPVFSQTLYQARVPEDAPVGASVLQVTAADADEGTNADIQYRLERAESTGGDGSGMLPFEVDPESGVIRIREVLDYESQRQYSLTVQAIDRGVPALNGRAEALIHLLDVNDNEPRVKFRYFPATSRFASVDENAAPGTVVALLTVSDADSPAANGNISVSILGGNEQRHFEVQSSKVPNLSLIKVAAALDRERIPTYNLTVAVTDNFGSSAPSPDSIPSSLNPDGASPAPVSRSSVASLVIFVNDINDHPPVFGQSVYQVNISEEVPPGSYVQSLSATDHDSGLNANLKYSIVSGNELGWFCISEHSGLVTTKSADTAMSTSLLGISGQGMAASGGLDREIVSQVMLNISARDQGVQPKVSFAKLVVNILDVNDEKPQFSKPHGYHVSIAENTPLGTELLVLTAVDGDLGDNGTVRYILQESEIGGNSGGFPIAFRLDPVSGRLSTISQLDREEQEHYSLHVLATDLGNPALSSETLVNVSLLDVNDNSPLFYPIQYFAHIQENEPAGSYVVTVSASDPDLGLNGRVRYSISAGDISRFQIHSQTGVITTKTTLDREEKTAYQLQVVASDSGNLQSQNQAIVTVTVLDTQDNPPVFTQEIYSFVVFENVALGYHVGSVSAHTMDLNINITYLITTGDQKGMFEINKMTGLITTASIIDREEQAFYQLKVVASGGIITGDALVNITVRDLNDNSPHFLHAVESVNVVENWNTGHTIFQARAVDPDEGANGMVAYSLKQNPKNLFSIDEQSGAISLTGLLDVNDGSYQVEIMASDLGVPERSSSFILTVSVHDVNDNPPVFDQLSYEVIISELEPVNSRFFSVHASDKDSGTNGEIAYNIIEGNTGDAFGIFPDGQLYIKSELDREVQDRYTLLVEASDRAVEPLSAMVNVTVILQDVNDNRPLFNSTNYVFYFEEEQKGESFVGKVSAVDKDCGSNGEVRYLFAHMQPDFELNALSGEITSTHQLDRESLMRQRGAAVFTLTVTAVDQGLPKPLRDQAIVQVYLKDINDNAPKFLKELYQATISELAPNLTQVLRVSASDVDEGNNGLIHYSIIEGNEENQFAIDTGTGQVTLIGKLDHEATAFYSLTIQAVDSGTDPLSSLSMLNINVLDENDNSPSFPKTILFVDILENMRIGELVTSTTATDSDSGDNADLNYSITGTNNHGTFSISPNTASIFLSKKLDFETQSLYKLNITAKDKGRPPRSSTMSVVIYVRDYNDNPPVFPAGDIFKSIVENIPIGTSVISVVAHDPDADINGQLAYTIIQQMPRGNHFHIDEVKGTIYTSAEIDREFANLFELTVKAMDQAVPIESRRFALKNVTVLITDQNDNVPTFVSPNALAVEPSVVIGTVLTTIVAADPDEGANGEVEYEIINGVRDIFILDRYSGELRVSSALVPSQLMYSFIISATDLGPERRKSTTEMTVILQGLDGPIFTQPKYITILKEGEPIGTNVISIEASSPGGPETLVEYFIVSVHCEDKKFGRLFTIGRHTGVIQTAAVLDREQGARLYLVDVYAIEKSAASPRTQKAEVEITLQDVNDNPPVFPTDMLDLTVEENIGDGSKIMQLTATDADEGANALVTYTIISGAEDSFHIDPESGELIATKRLDRERRSKYSLLVRADDGLQSSDMRINITVSDINDHTPKFSKLWYSFDIAEDTTPGSLVAAILATDEDSGVNGEITYIVSEDDGDGTFFLNPVTGVFNLTCTLDYEVQQYYVLTVCAQDGGGQSTTNRVYFNILDVNDNSPIFRMGSYSTSLMEDLPPGSTILVFNVTDADDGSNSQLSYSITSGDSLGQFSIDKNGVLSIKQTLDRESQSFYSLIVQVNDMASTPAFRYTSTTQVSIILLDVNDNPPSFISPKLTYIPENTPIDTIIFKAQATDPDSGPNSYIEYNLLNPSGNKFSIGTIDGEVRLIGELDRETVSNYTLTIIATDKGQPFLSSSTDIVAIILDINDNNPLFAQKLYKVEIAENTLTGTDVVQVFATDNDEGSNGQVRYTIISGNTNSDFRIDSVTGVITIAKPLDREKIASYSLTIQSADRGSSPRIDTTVVSIFLLDINDYIPTFELSPYTVNVPENLETLPRIILQVVARDDDQGLNSKLTYFLIYGNEDGAFTLSGNGELHLVQSLDREKKKEYIMLVTAVDSGIPNLTGTGTISVKVDDVNDNVPKFAFNMYSKTIPEDAPTGTDVLLVNASDSDGSVNAVISYSLSGGNSQFTINPSTGQIITSALLDREAKENYTLIVVAKDGGIPTPLSSSASVLVTIADVNDNPPKFQHHPYVTHIPSPTNTGTFVFAVTVTDADAGPNAKLHYSLSGKNSEKFHIDPSRGAIMVADRLSGTSEITFTVNVNDCGLLPKTDSTTVTVRFVNRADFPQVHAKQHKFMFPENQAVGTFITSVSGVSSRGDSLSYYIASGNLGGTFQIDQLTGQLSISQPLDYEAVQKYIVWIEARDMGFPPFSSYLKLEITVIDINDNAPLFEQDPFFVEVMENLSPSKIITVAAVDKDNGPNGQLNYDIINGNIENSFTIHHTTGEIRSVRPLDREQVGQYTLTVKASDRGSPTQSVVVQVLINVLDENDNAPKFSQIFSALVPENAPLGYTVTRVTTSDEDTGINAISRYSIRNTNIPFVINPNTGDITISRVLNREDTDRYRIRVSAHDSGWTVSTDVTIFVTDINDNSPRFTKPSYYLDYPESNEVGSRVTQISATDPDEGVNGQIFYFIKSQSEFFRINASTGEVFSKQPLKFQNSSASNHANLNRHSFIVIASDRGSPGLMSETTVTINVVDSNDNAPQFVFNQYFTPVTKNVAIGTKLIKVTAVDSKDFGLNAEIEYSISNKNPTDKFVLDSKTGWISVASSLMNEMNKSFLIKIKAKDKGNPPLSSEVPVQIAVTEENYYTPEFSERHLSITVPESHAVGGILRTMSAGDKDAAMNGIIQYNISSGNEAGCFAINSSTGALYLTKSLDYELRQKHEITTGQVTVIAELDREALPVYNLSILAIDSGSPSATGSASLLVTLEDINDNGPILSTIEGEIMENNRAGTFVMTLQSSDPDLAPNQGPFSYYLLSSGTATNYFSLSTAGVLTTTREIDREQISDFYLSVITRDSGIPQMSSTGTVHIKVIDKNDNPSQPRTVEIFVHYYGNLFPGGTLGSVKPQDPDILDTFQCSLTTGVTSVFNIPPGTCDLNSLARSTDGTFDLTVLSNDGLHNSVTNVIRVFFSGFNNATLDNSILLRLSVPSLKEFLTNYYLHFLRIANSQLTGLGTTVQLYGIFEDNNQTFLMVAVKRNNYQYVNTGSVTTFFESIKEIIFRQSGVQIQSVDHDSCLQNPCQNGGSCLRKLAVNPKLRSYDSVPVIIMANEPLQPFTCRCMPGYDGALCENDVNECFPLPCHNGGTCHNLVGGFSCSCPNGFAGIACERDVNECLSNPCKNGALCQNFPGNFNCICKPGYTGKTCDSSINYCECNPCFNRGSCQNGVEGYYCHCPFGVFGKHCEVNSYGFEELSYMEFPSMDPNNNYIYIKFSTIKSNALMLYNYDNQTGDRAEFLALEITEERLRFSYNLGSGTYKLTTAKKVSDGQFHTVIARRAGMAASLTVDSCSDEQEPGYCTVSNVAVSSDWTLDVQPNRVTIGGIKSLDQVLQRKGQVESYDFVGCIMEFAVNGRPLEPNQALSAERILDQCPRLEGTCAINPCQHGGTCLDHWSWQQCTCKEGLTGKHCEKYLTADTALSLEGKGRLDYHMRQNRKWEYMMRYYTGNAIMEPRSMGSLEVKFRTRNKSGVLIHIQESSNYTTVKIKNGKVQYVSDAGVGGKVERSIPEAYVSDGHWHLLLIEKNGTSTVITVDKIHSRDILHVTQDFGGLNVLTISLGGIPVNQISRSSEPDFDGCIAYLKYGEESLPFTGQHSLATISKSDSSVKIGCRGPNICASNPCRGELMCINQWYTYECVHPGACASNPCQNGGTCEPDERAGFICSCPESHTGTTCEILVVCLGVICAQGHVCKAGINGAYVCIPQLYPAELSLPLWAVPAIVCSCATLLALLVLSLILCNQCKGKKAKVPKEEKKTKEKKKKGSENDAFDDPDNIPPYGDDMTIRKQPEGNPKPDIIERENPYLIFDETDISHNTETIPSAPLASPEAEIEHYDIDNASSIAPSDADIIQHYKQFRSHTPKFSIQRHSPLGFARQSPMPLGASSLTYQPSYSQGLRTTSLNHSACPTPNHLSRHSPAPFSKASTFYRNSPAREMHLSIREGSPLEMHNEVCHTAIFNYPSRLGRRSKSPQMMTGHSSRPGSRLKQPIGQISLESGPPVGLSIEEVERLNTPRPRNPSICSADHGRSSSEEDCRRPLSRTRNPADGIPAPESSSDSDSHDSFTCSEMEYDREKPMVYTSRMPKLSQVNESDADDEDNYGARLKPRRYPGRRGEGGGPVGAQAPAPASSINDTSPLKLGPQGGNFNWDNLLNWGPGFGHYVDVFKDLASLPEKTATNVSEECRNGTTQPKDGEAEQYV
ncbi:protocadherin Fat 4 isoform X2 [Ahaetulla prasina]|uniref:protocadherin Fat 4 isoform X2 n=1 Tax=Ahaetulla prasina TaxID=499056 RepID=UPI002649D6B1|nr:protocadherin Fat 4 isoform X2 [Ahaetulla prasina]